jgi:hypothetical protein
MKAETWMNRDPVPRKTPLQQAQQDLFHWKRELDKAEQRAEECRREYRKAVYLVTSL